MAQSAEAIVYLWRWFCLEGKLKLLGFACERCRGGNSPPRTSD